MITFSESASALKGLLANSGLNQVARMILLREVVAFIMHRGRMSCSAEPIGNTNFTGFLLTPPYSESLRNRTDRSRTWKFPRLYLI